MAMVRGRRLLAVAMLAGAAGAAGCGSSGVTAELASLKAQMAALKLQAQATQDWTAIANLQASYGFYMDNMRWDDAADLFAQESTLEIAGGSVIEGQGRIREYLRTLESLRHATLFNHALLQPVINVEPGGLKAKARWRSFAQAGQPGAVTHGNDAIHENEYVKEEGIWKIRKLHGVIFKSPRQHQNPAAGRGS